MTPNSTCVYRYEMHHACLALSFCNPNLAERLECLPSKAIPWCMGSCGPVERALDWRSELRSGFDSQCLPCVEVSGKLTLYSTLPWSTSHNGYLVHRSKFESIVAGYIGAHLARGKVKSVEHALPWSLDSKQLPLPLCMHACGFEYLAGHLVYINMKCIMGWQ